MSDKNINFEQEMQLFSYSVSSNKLSTSQEQAYFHYMLDKYCDAELAKAIRKDFKKSIKKNEVVDESKSIKKNKVVDEDELTEDELSIKRNKSKDTKESSSKKGKVSKSK